MELARQEIAGAAAADLTMRLMNDLSYPRRREEIKEIYDPPPILRARGLDRASHGGAICAQWQELRRVWRRRGRDPSQENWRLAEQTLGLDAAPICGAPTPSSNRAPKLVATRERRVGKISRQKYDVHRLRPPPLNPQTAVPHLYSQTKGSLLTKSESRAC